MATSAGGRITASAGVSLLSQQTGVGTQNRTGSQHATVYVGNLDTAAREELVYELFVQFGPVLNVYMPKDRVRFLNLSHLYFYHHQLIPFT